MDPITERRLRDEEFARRFFAENGTGWRSYRKYVRVTLLDPLSELLAVPAAIAAALLLVGALVSLVKSIAGAF